MLDSLEADLIAAHQVAFPRDRASWTDAYVTAASRLEPDAEPAAVAEAALAAWYRHGWAHPAVVAHWAEALAALADE